MSVVPSSPFVFPPIVAPAPAGPAVWSRALREAGLLRPALAGGWREVLQTLRDLSERDGGLARLFAVHHLQLARVRLLGSREQLQRLLALSQLHEPLWGSLGEEGGRALQAVEHVRGGFRAKGVHWDAFASEAADWLLLRAWHAPAGDFLLAAVPRTRSGLSLRPALGQVRCHDLRLHPEDVLLQPGLPATPQRLLCDGLALLLEASLALGLALEAAQRLDLQHSPEASRLLALGLGLGEQAALQLDADIEAAARLGFARAQHFANLAIQALAVSRQAAHAVLRTESLEARIKGAAH